HRGHRLREVPERESPPGRYRVAGSIRLRVLKQPLEGRHEEEVAEQSPDDGRSARPRLAENDVGVAFGVQVHMMIHVSGAMTGPGVAEQIREEVTEHPVETRIAEQGPVVTLVNELSRTVERPNRKEGEERRAPPGRKEPEHGRNRHERRDRDEYVQRAP